MSVFWMSFVGGSGFLGGAFVRGDCWQMAMTRSHLLGINPGGEVEFVELPVSAVLVLPERYVERLLSKEEIAEMDAFMSLREGQA